MNIKYLKSLKSYKGNRTFKKEGISIENIEVLEEKYNDGNLFPLSIREFMYLAGKKSAIAMDKGNGWDWLQQESRLNLVFYEDKIDRPFFVIHQLDNCMMFLFIYLDEIEDNPKVFSCYVDAKNDDEEFIKPVPQERFVELIEAKIIAAISDDKYLRFDED